MRAQHFNFAPKFCLQYGVFLAPNFMFLGENFQTNKKNFRQTKILGEGQLPLPPLPQCHCQNVFYQPGSSQTHWELTALVSGREGPRREVERGERGKGRTG